jgi:RNA-directed DNA polymerase
LDADIKGCFDNINHDSLLKLMADINPSDKKIVRQWLKSGVMDKQIFSPLDKGTPQGGIISPLLANIALDGIWNHLFNELKKEYKSHRIHKKIKGSTFTVVRYADDFVIIHKDKEIIEKTKELLETWLLERGLELSQEKTRIVHSSDGFDFLGFNSTPLTIATICYNSRL